ncbi:MAG: urease accessory protein UreE [Acidithiobacillus sp.]
MWTITARRVAEPDLPVMMELAMTAEDRARVRSRIVTPTGELLQLQLPRGITLHPGDILLAPTGEAVARVIAQAEAVFTVWADHPLLLLRAAYHLGNRHVAMEITVDCLRIKPDRVLAHMLEGLGLRVSEEDRPFLPEPGAYAHHHG